MLSEREFERQAWLKEKKVRQKRKLRDEKRRKSQQMSGTSALDFSVSMSPGGVADSGNGNVPMSVLGLIGNETPGSLGPSNGGNMVNTPGTTGAVAGSVTKAGITPSGTGIGGGDDGEEVGLETVAVGVALKGTISVLDEGSYRRSVGLCLL